MREIGAMWQIGVLTGKTVHFFWSKMGHFRRFWHYKNKERVSKGLDVKWHIPSTCLDASRKVVFYWNLQHKQGFRWAVARNPSKALKIAKMCTVSRLECQFATLYLFHAPTRTGPPSAAGILYPPPPLPFIHPHP